MLEDLASDRVVKKGGPIREVLLHYRPETDAPGALQRLELSEENYFAVSACCEPCLSGK